MAEDLIEHYIDRNSFAGDTKFATDELSKLKASYDNLRKSRANLIETTSTQQTIEETKQWRLEIEKLRAKNLELSATLKEQRLEAARMAAEKKAQADAEKIRIDNEKRAEAERRIAEVERMRALKEQQEKEEQLAAIEKQRLETEKQRTDLGPYSIPQGSGQAGPGKITRSNTEEFIPDAGIQTNILSLAQLRSALKDNIEAQKELEKQVKDGTITQSEYDKAITNTIEQEQIYRSQIKQTSAEIKAQIDANLAIQGTLDAARKENMALAKERDQLVLKGDNVTPEDIARRDELNNLIDKNNELIDKNSDALARQKINIGNYPNAFGSAFKTLNAEMTNLEQKLSSGKFQGEELEQLKIRLEALQNAAKMTGQEFKTVNEQQRAYNEAAKQIGLVYGKNSDVFKQFSKEVGTGNKALNDLSKEVSNASTGSKGLAGGLSNVWSAIRRIAYVVPGLGIAGIITLMLVPLKSLGIAFIDLFKTINSGKDDIKAMNDVNIKAADIFSKQTAQVSALAKVVGDESKALDVRKDALKELVNISPEYLRGLSLENINTYDGAVILERYNEALRNSARLKASKDVFEDSEKRVAELNAVSEAFDELTKNGNATFADLTDQMKKFVGDNITRGLRNPLRNFFDMKVTQGDVNWFFSNINKEIQKAQKQSDAALSAYNATFEDNFASAGGKTKGIIEKLQEQINDLRKEQPTLLSEEAISKNVAQIKVLQDELNRLLGVTKNVRTEGNHLLDQFHAKNLKAISDYSKANLLILQDMYQKQMNDQNLSETLRLQSLENYLATSKQLIEKDRKTQEESLLNETANARRDAARIKDARARANVLAEISAYETNQMKVINQKFGNDITKLDQDTANKRWQISADAWQKIRDDAEKSAKFIQQQQELAFKNEQSKVDIDKYNALAELQEQYQSGSIRSIEEYDAKRAQIEQDADNKQKQLQLDRLKQNEAIFEAMYGLQNLDWIKSIKQLEFEINDSANKKILDSDKALLSAQDQLRQRRNEMLHESLNALSDFVNSSFDARKQDADQEKKDIEDRAQRQIDLINASTLSEEEKAARTKQINEASAAQQEQIDKRTAEQQERQAKFNKAIAVMNIAITTAETIAKITASAAAVRATYAIAGPAGVAAGNAIASILMGQIPFVLGSAALQAAAVLAKPIPKFKHGKNTGGYEGPAIVGDGGVSEYIVREDGRIEKTPPRDTLTYIGRHETIFPDFESLIKNTQSKMPSIRHQDNLHSVMETQNKLLRQSLSQLNKIASKRENHITAKDGALVGLWKYGARQSRYIDENTNW